MILQSKCWYYLGPFQTFKAELFVKIVFRYKALTFSVKTSNLDLSLVLWGASNKYFSFFVNEDFVNKKALNICTRMLEFTFPGEDVIYYKGDGWAGTGVVIKKGKVEYIKIFIWEELLINGKFFLIIGTAPPPPAITLHIVYTWRTVYWHLIFSRLAFSCSYCAF